MHHLCMINVIYNEVIGYVPLGFDYKRQNGNVWAWLARAYSHLHYPANDASGFLNLLCHSQTCNQARD
jgi:hypothetical protein